MAQPNLAPSKPKKKKIPRKPSAKQLAREKFNKKIEEIKTRVEKPLLNTIGTPSGIEKAKGKKKGKKFINEDKNTLLAIVAEVNEKTDGAIKSKLQRAREMETIRQAKQRENEAKTESKKARMEEKGKEILRKQKRKGRDDDNEV